MRLKRVRLREVRLRKFMTQPELAQRSGVGVVTISRIETGHHLPRLATIRKLAKALGVDPAELVEFEEDDDDAEQADAA